MEIHYTVNKNALILISLMKQYGIKKVIASPGTVNVPLHPNFEIIGRIPLKKESP